MDNSSSSSAATIRACPNGRNCGRKLASNRSLESRLQPALTLSEQSRLLHLLIERVDFDGRTDDISITFHPTGIKTLADELAEK